MSWHIGLPPGISKFFSKKNDTPKDLWIKDPTTGELEFRKEVEENLFVMTRSGYHLPIDAPTRLKSLFDDGAWESVPTPEISPDPIRFPLKMSDGKRYSEKLKEAYKKTGTHSAVIVGVGKLEDLPVTIAAYDFRFIGGTLARAEGEAIMTAFKVALKRRTPLILVTASGGARMQEGIYSLVQMVRTTIAFQDMREAKLPYIVVFASPTYGGVTASHGMLGDITIGEPSALIGFSGQDLIRKTLNIKVLPEGFQSAESHLENGTLDMIVDRRELRATLSRVCRLLTKAPAPENKVAA